MTTTAKRHAPAGLLAKLAIEPYVAGICLVAIGWHLISSYWLHTSWRMKDWPLLAVLVIGGTPFVAKLLYGLAKRRYGADLLAGISIVVSVILGEYLAGTVILLMLSGGATLEEFAMRRASSVLSALAKRMPQTAHRQSDSKMEDIALGDVRMGEHACSLSP